jgi:hypothetical protein
MLVLHLLMVLQEPLILVVVVAVLAPLLTLAVTVVQVE